MHVTKYLLIGGGLAAGRAVEGIREDDLNGPITLVGQEQHLPYNRPPLSKGYLREEQALEEIYLETQEYYREAGVTAFLGVTVETLDLEAKEAHLSNGELITYEKALLATGGTPIMLDIPGADQEGVHTLRVIENSTALQSAADTYDRAVIIGAGFIGMELAASLTELGVDVSVVELKAHIWPRFADAELAGFFQAYFEEMGIDFYLEDTVEKIHGDHRVERVTLASGQELAADFVCIAVGIRPNTSLAEAAGLEVDDGVIVNEYLQTSDPDVFAAGDIANYPDPYFSKRRRVEHWGQADYTGALAGLNMTGVREPYTLLTYIWSELFDLHLEFAGDHTEADEQVQRGDFEDEIFTRFFLKDNRLTAYFAISPEDDELAAWNQLIEEAVDLSDKKEQLTNPDVEPETLLP